MAFESDDATLVADHVGALPLSVALVAARERGVPPSLEVGACIAVRVLDGAPAGNVASREITIALNGSVRVSPASAAPTNTSAVAVILWEMYAGRPPANLAAVLRNVTRYRSASEMARAIERAVKPAPAVAVGAWLEAACGRIAPVRPPPRRSRVARLAPFGAAVVALFLGFAIAWVCAPRRALASSRFPRSLEENVRGEVRLVGRVPIAAVPIESLPAPVIVTQPRSVTASCDNPFRVDERGIRRVRRECL